MVAFVAILTTSSYGSIAALTWSHPLKMTSSTLVNDLRAYNLEDMEFEIWHVRRPGNMDAESASRIDEYNVRHGETLKKRCNQKLIASLSALRTTESSDVTLVCEEREFYAHKVVLEASSPYFVSMFRSGMEESVSGRVMFKEMKPEILDIILDYIYLGEIKKLESEETIKAVLVNAHLLELTELFDYCGNVLEVSVSRENFSELWQIGLKYEHKGLTGKVMSYVQTHLREVINSPQSHELSAEQILTLLGFLDGKIRCFDMVLELLANWLIHDPGSREKLARDLFSHVDVKLVTKDCIKSLLENEKVMKSSEEIGNRMNELGVAILLSESAVSAETPTKKLFKTKDNNVFLERMPVRQPSMRRFFRGPSSKDDLEWHFS